MYVVPEDAPTWLALAAGEQGVKECPGGVFNPRIREYFWATSLHPGDDSVAWCSAFVNWVMKRDGKAGSGSAAARSWLKWGTVQSTPKPGSVAVFWRDREKGSLGHVGFYVGETATDVLVLGGNQKDAVCVASYPKRRLLGYRWPSA